MQDNLKKKLKRRRKEGNKAIIIRASSVERIRRGVLSNYKRDRGSLSRS